jgi:hypothetical protein
VVSLVNFFGTDSGGVMAALPFGVDITCFTWEWFFYPLSQTSPNMSFKIPSGNQKWQWKIPH